MDPSCFKPAPDRSLRRRRSSRTNRLASHALPACATASDDLDLRASDRRRLLQFEHPKPGTVELMAPAAGVMTPVTP
jgi:hypothetical protein